MAITTDFQYAHRNNERREENTVGGEYIHSEDGTLVAGDGAVVCSIPANSILVGITLVGPGLAAATKPVVTIGATAYTAATTVKDKALALVVAAPVYFPDAAEVKITADVDITAGRLLVLPRFIEFDLTTGNRVNPA